MGFLYSDLDEKRGKKPPTPRRGRKEDHCGKKIKKGEKFKDANFKGGGGEEQDPLPGKRRGPSIKIIKKKKEFQHKRGKESLS